MLNKGRMGEKPMRNKEQAILEAAEREFIV